MKRFCSCPNSITSDPCIICGKPKLVTKEWIRRKAQAEQDGEVGAGLLALDPTVEGPSPK